ncbi:MAG TPA: DUF1552 domain-containing protein, partial [Pirellulales bacterium]|nr:DUF1552 domain-containing protein [Pirellulales bacterium]
MKPISRRTILRGMGTALTLPWLEAMTPLTSLAKQTTGTPGSPLRVAFLMVPNGAHMAQWTPESEGASFEFPRILKPLNPFKDDLLVLSGLSQDLAAAHGDGGGDHARS